MRYYKQGLPPVPAEFVKATMETKMANNPFAVWFNETFETKENCKVSIDQIVGMGFVNTREECITHLKRIGIQYNKDLKGFEKKGDDEKYKKGGIEGWRLKTGE